MSAPFVVRPAQIGERELLEALQRRASLAREENREALLANPDAIVLPAEHLASGHTLVAESGGQILGFCVVLPRDDGDAELDGLFVEPQAWGSGLGTLLVQHAGGVAARTGAAWLWVVTSASTVGFYARCGFEEAGEAQTRFGRAVLMKMPVMPPQS